MAQTARNIATEDVTVEAPHATAEDLANLEAAAKAPVPKNVMEALEAAGDRNRAAQSAARKTAKATKPVAKVAKPKAVKKVTTVERVPAADVIAFIESLGMTRTQFGQAVGLKPSSVSEIVGKGRGHLLAKSRWPEFQKKAKAAAKGLK